MWIVVDNNVGDEDQIDDDVHLFSLILRLTTWTQLDSAWNQATVRNHLILNITNT